MQSLPIKITISQDLYLKNPDATALGQRILEASIVLINELGFEKFTFKKLSEKIQSPESSIYRYFENKHALLIYLISWYWSWMEYRIVMATTNISSSIEKLEKAICVLTEPVLEDTSISYINEILLNKIIIAESVKAYHTKQVDDENQKGYFETYKHMVNRLVAILLEVNPNCVYPKMLITTVIEGAHQQHFFSEHLSALTDTKNGKKSITDFYTTLILKTISTNTLN